MRSVVLIGSRAADPAGSAAVRHALHRALPNHDLVEPSGSAGPRLGTVDGVVVAGPSPEDVAAALARGALVASRQRVPLACVGLPAGPGGRVRRSMVRAASARAQLFLAADGTAASWFRAAGVPGPIRVAADPAWLALDRTLVPAGAPAPARPGPRNGTAGPPGAAGLPAADGAGRGDDVTVVVDGRLSPQAERALAAGLVTLARAGRPIRLVPWGGPGSPDPGAASRLLLAVLGAVPGGATKTAAPATLAEAAETFSQAYAVVTTRHRAAQAAAAAGTPVVGIGTDPTVTATVKLLGQPVVHPDDDLSESLPVTVERLGAAPPPVGQTVAAQTRRAEAALRLLRLVIEPDAVAAADIDPLPMEPAPWLS